MARLPTLPRATWLEMTITAPLIASISDHVPLEEGFSGGDPLVAENGEVEATVAAMNDQLGDGAADSGGVLQAVAGKAVGVEKIRQGRIGADDRVLVQDIVVVVAGPRARHLQ